MYDPAIGRFTGVDPIAEQFAFVSGFNYAENRPVNGIDLHGLQFFSTISGAAQAEALHPERAKGLTQKAMNYEKVSGADTITGIGIAVSAGYLASSGAIGTGLLALRTSISNTTSSISSNFSSLVSTMKTSVKSLFMGSAIERTTAVGIDITSQVVVNSATGADFNLASTTSAALMPNAYFTQGFIAGAVELNVTEREGGGTKIEPNLSVSKGLVGGFFGKVGGEFGDAIGKAMNSTSGKSGVSMASLLKNLPSLVTTSSREVINEGIK